MNGAIITQTMRSDSSAFQIVRDSDSSAPRWLKCFHGSLATMYPFIATNNRHTISSAR